jgi:anti-anti-sigma factor
MSIPLQLSTTRIGAAAALVTVVGEIDLATAGELGDHLVAALHEAGPDVVLDLSQVTFMDSTGLKVLLAAHRRAQLAGGHLALAGAGRSVLKVLTITGLDRTFLLAETVDGAIESVRSAPAPQAAAD